MAAGSSQTAQKQTFKYVAKDKNSTDPEKGIFTKQVTALNEASARNFLERQGLIVYDIEKVDNTGLNKDLGSLGFNRPPKTRDIARWARLFATLYRSGIPVTTILKILADQEKNQRLKDATNELMADIEDGDALAVSMGRHPDVFPPFMTAMVSAAESSGSMDTNMAQLAATLESEVRLKAKIKSAMTYPVVVFILAIIICAALLLFIVPTFAEMFETLGGALPLPTQVMMWLSDFLKVGIIPIVIVLGAGIFLLRKNKNNIKQRRFFDPLKLKLPVFGDLFTKVAVARFARNLSTLMGSGVPILEALTIVPATINSTPFEDAVAAIKTSVENGETIAAPMGEHEVFPEMATQMIEVGEESGQSEEMLLKIAETYDEEVEITTESLTALIEPLMMIFLGVIVGGMVVSLYLPLFSIYDLIE